MIMGMWKIRLKRGILFLWVIVISSCSIVTPIDNTINFDVTGHWSGYLLMDGSGNERTTDGVYFLNVSSDDKKLTGELAIPDQNGSDTIIALTIDQHADSTIEMTGVYKNTDITIYGLLESDNSLQLAINKGDSKCDLVFLRKADNSESTWLKNSSKLELKIGQVGVGRSVILVHGINEDASVWTDMLDYFKSHGINTITKGEGTLSLPKKNQSNLVFDLFSTNTQLKIGTALADISYDQTLSDKSDLTNSSVFSITIKSTTIAGVNRFRVNDDNNSFELNKKTIISTNQNAVKITLLRGENALGNVWVFEYKWWDHILDNAQIMYDSIKSRQKSGEISAAPLIVGYSMGGLVTRAYLNNGGDFYKLITLGTPHLGSNLASFVPFGNYDGIGDLKYDSDFITSINSDQSIEKNLRSNYWLINGRTGTYPSCYLGTIPTCYKWHLPEPTVVEKAGYASLSKPNDGIVPQWSSRFSGNETYKGDDHVHNVDTFEWLDHKMLAKDDRVSEWIKNFILNN